MLMPVTFHGFRPSELVTVTCREGNHSFESCGRGLAGVLSFRAWLWRGEQHGVQRERDDRCRECGGPKIGADEARKLIGDEDALVVDVRDAPEVQASGKIKNALHVSRGMLEFRADAETPYHDNSFRKDRPIILYCASGGRSALSGKVLKDMGYERVYNLGAFKDWAENGGEVEKLS